MRPLPSHADHGLSLGAFLSTHLHAFARSELLARWPRSALDRALRDGSITRIVPGVYCASEHAADPVITGEALNRWAPHALVSGELALHLYAPSLPAPRRADLVVPHGQHMRAPSWVRLRQSGPFRVSSAPQGIACVVPERALLDAWRWSTSDRRHDILYGALWARVCTWRQLARVARNQQRVSGRRDLERHVAWFAKGATSPLEVRARREVFTGQSFREFEWQAKLVVSSRVAVADLLHRAAKVVVELDGARYHQVNDTWQADRARDVDLAAAGYVTLRFGWDDIVRRPDWCRTRLLEVLNSRARTRPTST